MEYAIQIQLLPAKGEKRRTPCFAQRCHGVVNRRHLRNEFGEASAPGVQYIQG
jgi:hypothetical protein